MVFPGRHNFPAGNIGVEYLDSDLRLRCKIRYQWQYRPRKPRVQKLDSDIHLNGGGIVVCRRIVRSVFNKVDKHGTHLGNKDERFGIEYCEKVLSDEDAILYIGCDVSPVEPTVEVINVHRVALKLN